MHTNDCRKLLTDKAPVKTEFRKFPADMQAKIDWIQLSLDGEVKRKNYFHCKRVWLIVSEKSLKRQLQLRSDQGQDVMYLKYRLNSAVSKEGRSQTFI